MRSGTLLHTHKAPPTRQLDHPNQPKKHQHKHTESRPTTHHATKHEHRTMQFRSPAVTKKEREKDARDACALQPHSGPKLPLLSGYNFSRNSILRHRKNARTDMHHNVVADSSSHSSGKRRQWH
eukprot:4489611-Lingulodinium_polyedra.AAC.1